MRPAAAAAPSAASSNVNATSGPVAADPLPDVGLAGVNLIGCRSDFRPVILLHGSFSTVVSNFTALVPALRAGHRCVYALNYGHGGLDRVTSSAGQFARLVSAVLSLTGRGQVDVVAYSQGGLVLRAGLRLDRLADKVATAVLIAPSWNGTTSPLVGSVPAGVCPACADQRAGSDLLQELAAGGDLDGNVRYAEISTSADTVVTPVASQVPIGPPDRVRAIVVEDRCPLLVTDHIRLPAARGVIGWTLAALATDGRPPPTALTC